MKKWTEAEFTFLKDNHRKMDLQSISLKIQKSIPSIKQKLYRHSLSTVSKGSVSHSWHLNRYKQSAKDRNIEFSLSKDEFKALSQQICFYCGALPKDYTAYSSKSLQPKHNKVKLNSLIKINGLDRVDNNLGYIKENCVACCTTCNRMKLDHSTTEFKSQILKIYNYFIQGKE